MVIFIENLGFTSVPKPLCGIVIFCLIHALGWEFVLGWYSMKFGQLFLLRLKTENGTIPK